MSRVRILRKGGTVQKNPVTKNLARDGRRRVINAGCGIAGAQSLHPIFRDGEWNEIRLDVDPGVEPDYLGSLANLSEITADASIDAVWCSHNIEHFHDHEVAPALRECRRVLKSDGFALFACPDLEAVVELIAERGVEAVAYTSPAGPIRALDILYGHTPSIAAGKPFMGHKTGFTQERMGRVITEAGFAEVRVARGPNFSLWAIALMENADTAAIARKLSATSENFLFASDPGEIAFAPRRQREQLMSHH